jgi:hypothetical protein
MGAFFALMPRWGWIALGAVVLLAAFYFTLDAYGDSRAREAAAKQDAIWQKAHDRLIQKDAEAKTKADKAAAARAADYAVKVEDEKEKIDATVAKGGDHFDVLFNTVGG